MTEAGTAAGRSVGRRKWSGRVDPCKARTLQPGVTGFLFTVNPQQTEKAKREAMTLLSHYTDLVLKESAGDEVAKEEAPGPSTKAHRSEAKDVASSLAEELAGGATHGGGETQQRKPKWNAHPLLRHVDTKVKGYIFISVSQPDDGAGEAADSAPTPAEPPTAEVAAPEGETAEGSSSGPGAAEACLKPENTLVCAIADAMWDDLVARPRPVARFTYRCYPVPVSTFPTRHDAIAEAARRSVVSWRTETLVPADDEEAANLTEAELKYRTAPVAVWTGVSVRNNTNIDKVKGQILQSVNDALIRKTDGGCLLQVYFAAKGAALVEQTRATVYVNVLVMQSVALVAIQPSYVARKQYNLGSVSGDALHLPDMVAAPSTAPAKPSSGDS
eukprot:CAMPEP_0174846084 /NCGR_PEP_ID=MMETSP1114-20130205/12118_1 /TAXON_ID=312471 /ORGANISM="Neobodo designis, Strain CCAP 1951/1" /LENGTH=386 /DNA_ID=CAMNT_0016080345 /DNA_START=27 /DNA_END=1184 /DNA_ORIENTATION=+